MMDAQFEEAMVNLLALWINDQDDEGQDHTMLPVIMYRFKDEAKRRGYEPLQ